MRKFEFRCWVLRDSEDDGEIIPYMGDMREVESYFQPFEEHRKGNIILLQSTGLVDRNGKDIFEGDILMLDMTAFQIDKNFEQFVIADFFPDTAYLKTQFHSNAIEVIGNIYELA